MDDAKVTRHKHLLHKIDYALQVKPQKRWAARRIARALQKRLVITAHVVFNALSRAAIAHESGEQQMQVRAVVRPILLRKVKAFGLHVFTFCRRVSLDLLFQGLHTWRHFSLKKTMMDDQARLLNLLQCSQIEVQQYQAKMVHVQVLGNAGQENQILVHKLRTLSHIHRCLLTVEHALHRLLRDAFVQIQMHNHAMNARFQTHMSCASPYLKSVLVSLIHQRLRWACRRWNVAIEAKIARIALRGALETYDTSFAGLAAIQKVGTADRTMVLESMTASKSLVSDETFEFDIEGWVFGRDVPETVASASSGSSRQMTGVQSHTRAYNGSEHAPHTGVPSNSVVAAMRSLMLESLSEQETHGFSSSMIENSANETLGRNSYTKQRSDGYRKQQSRAVHALSGVLHRVLARRWLETWTCLRQTRKTIHIPVKVVAVPAFSSRVSSVPTLTSAGFQPATSGLSGKTFQQSTAKPSSLQVTQPGAAVQSSPRSPVQWRSSASPASSPGRAELGSKMGRIEAGLARLANAVGPRFADTPNKHMWSPATWTPGALPSGSKFRA